MVAGGREGRREKRISLTQSLNLRMVTVHMGRKSVHTLKYINARVSTFDQGEIFPNRLVVTVYQQSPLAYSETETVVR